VDALPLKGAHNLSGWRFDSATRWLLNAGLQFIPTPAAPTAPQQWSTAYHRFERSVRLRCQFHGSRQARDPRYHVPDHILQPKPAPPLVEDFLADVWVAVAAFYMLPRPRCPAHLCAQYRRALAALRPHLWALH
jgi:hypothetical protein